MTVPMDKIPFIVRGSFQTEQENADELGLPDHLVRKA